MSSGCMFEDPYHLTGALPLGNAPFLSHILFSDVAKQEQRPCWQFQVVDATNGKSRRMAPEKRHAGLNVGVASKAQMELDDGEGGDTLSGHSDAQAFDGGLRMPSRIVQAGDETADGSGVFPQSTMDADAEKSATFAAFDFAKQERNGDSDVVPFATKLAELERRMGEQLEVHQQLNGALSALDTVSRGVRNAITDDVVAGAMVRHHRAAVDALNSHTLRPACGHAMAPGDGVAKGVPVPAGMATAATTPDGATNAPRANKPAGTTSLPAGSGGSAALRQAPSTTTSRIVRPDHDVVEYTRKVLRPRATTAPPDALLLPTKSVSYAAGATVTHFDRDSPPVSASRAAWEGAQRSQLTDSVRLSSSIDASPLRDRMSSVPSQYSVQDSIATTLPRSESSSSLIRVSYVDRNLASSRRTMSVMTEEDMMTVTSDSGSSSPSIVRDESFLSSSHPSSRRRDSIESLEGVSRSGGATAKSMHYLFDMFHRLCLKATDVLGSLDDPARQALSATATAPNPPMSLAKAAPTHDAREDLHDVMRLQHFIRVLTDDVKGLEALRKARVAKEKLMLRARKIASARRRMLRDRRASLAEVEEEFDVVMSVTQRRGRRGAVQDDDIEDETIGEEFPFTFGSPSGDMTDEIADDIDFEDDAMDLDDDIEDEFDDHNIAEDLVDQLPEGLEEDLLAATRLLDEEEDLAEYLVDHDVEDIIRSPPAQLRLIRYGGTKQQPTEDRQRSETNDAAAAARRPDSRGSHSSHSSFYSSVEDEEEIAEAERKKRMAHAAAADVPWPISAVEEDESLAHLTRDRLRESVSPSSTRSTPTSIHTSVATGESGPSRSSRQGTDGHRRGSDLQSPLKRSLSRKLTGGQLKRSKSTLERRQSTLRVVESPTVLALANSDESDDWRSSASSGDADVASCHPFSTPYTSCTTIDSSVEIANMPRGMEARMTTNDGQNRKFIDRQKWMETEKRRRKALRSIAPLHTFTQLYDPCESTPSRPSSGSTKSNDGTARPPTDSSKANVAVRKSDMWLQEGDVAAGRLADESEGSVSLSPMSLASPAHPLRMLVTTDQLQTLPPKDINQRYATAVTYGAALGTEAVSESDGDEDDHSSGASMEPSSPPRGIQVTPPPTGKDAARRSDVPLETPTHSIDWGGQAGAASAQPASVNVGGESSTSMRDAFAMYRTNVVKPDDDDVRIGVSPIPDDEGDAVALPLGQSKWNADKAMVYDQDDLVALNTWKERQMASVRTLWPGADDGAPLPDAPTGGDEEGHWAREASSHWAALEAMLAHRFAAKAESFDASSSYSSCSSSRSSSSYASSLSSRCDSSDIDNTHHAIAPANR